MANNSNNMITITDDNSGPKWAFEGSHGRQEELNVLNKIAERKSSACILIEGNDGCGKTTLMRVVNWEEKGWTFIAQKFEKHMSTAPYSALTRAVDELVEIWCTNNEKSPETCKMTGLLDLLEKDMDLLQNVIPGLFRVLDKFTKRMQFSKTHSKLFASQSNLSKMSLCSSISSIRDLAGSQRQRGKLGSEKMGGDSAAIAASFQRLFSFLSSTNPIVLSFDDVHYADASSMEILKLVAQTSCTKKLKNSNSKVLLTLSYTEMLERNRVAFKAIKQIKSFRSNVHFLHLRNWNVSTINDLVASLVKADPQESLSLSEVIHKKTGGNPFAVTRILRYAREQGHFKFSSLTFKWEWADVDFLDQCFAVSDNVAEVLASTMANDCTITTNLLMVASCLGHFIPTDVLVEYFGEETGDESKHSPDSKFLHLREVELVELLDGAVKAGILVKSVAQGVYTWSNDLLQQATYESMPESMRNQLHLKLGRLLWRMSMDLDEQWMIFMAANQINLFSELDSDSCLGNEVAGLNLQAAYLSLSKGAIYPALELLLKAEKHMVAVDRWNASYELTHDVLTTLAETKLRVGETGTAFTLAAEVVQNAKTYEDTFPAHIVMLQCTVCGNDRNYDMGIKRTLLLLKFYGEKHSWKFYRGQATLEKAMLKAKIKKLLPDGEVEGLFDKSDMSDKGLLRIQTLLVNHLAVYASYSPKYKSLSWFASARALKSACKHGISPVTNLALVQLATHLRVDGHYKEASRYAEIALQLTEGLRRTLGSDHGQVRMIACGSVFSAVRSFNNCLNELMECRADFLRSGFVRESISIAIGYTITYLCVGLSLGAVKSDLEAHTADAIHYGCPYNVEQKMRILDQTIVNLTDDVAQPTFLSGEVMNQDDELEKVEGLGAMRVRLGMDACRLMLCCIFCDWLTAKTLVDDLQEHDDMRDGFLMRSHFRRCYVGLAAFALSREENDPKLRKKYLSIGRKILKSFTKEMKHGSVNAFPIVTMLEAEQLPTKERYDKAIKATARLGLVHHEAYMCERAAEMFQGLGDDEWCNHYISEAILLYGEWGAKGKVNRLFKDYADLLQPSTLRESMNTSLQSRSRYSAQELDSLRTIDWKDFNRSVHDDFDFSYRSARSGDTIDISSRSVRSVPY